MTRTSLEYLFRVDAPWIYIGHGEPERAKWIPQYFYNRSGMNVCTRQLRGQKMRTTRGLMNEFGAALQFFKEFGENWLALLECLEYLDEWLPADAYILDIEDADAVLVDEPPNQMAALLRTLDDAGEWWSRPVVDNDRFNRPARPFHALLHVSEDNYDFAAILRDIAAADGIPVRFDANAIPGPLK